MMVIDTTGFISKAGSDTKGGITSGMGDGVGNGLDQGTSDC